MNRVATTIVLAALLALAFVLLLAPAAQAQTPAATVKDDGGNVVLKSFVDGGLLAPEQNGGAIPAEGAGARMMWYPGKAAFRVGEVDGSQWDDSNIGSRSVAFGYRTTASGENATAMGNGTTASGDESTAMGFSTTATTNQSLSLGECNDANKNSATSSTLLVVGNGDLGPDGDFCLNSNDALVLDDAGNLEIAGTLTEGSDRRLKTDIEPLSEGVLGALGEIDPVRYRFKNEQTHPSGEQIGLIAQDVRAHFPELVREGSGGMLSLAYPKLTAVLLKGLQEQQSTIEEQNEEIAALKAENEEIKDRLAALETDRTPSTAGWAGGLPLRGLGVLLVGGLLGAGLLALRRR